jgi:hypothetical protein
MEPTDQPPPTPQTWAETSAWAPSVEQGSPAAWTPPHPSVQQQPTADDYVRPAGSVGVTPKVRRERSSRRSLILATLLTEVVVIAASNNQWVTEKVASWSNHHSGFLAEAVVATQSFAWRLTPPAGDSIQAWPASLVRLAVLFVFTAVLVAVLARGAGAFWRAFVGAGLAVVFAGQLAAIGHAAVLSGGIPRRYVDYLPTSSNGVLYGGGDGGAPGRLSQAFFGSGGSVGPTGFTFFGATLLALVVGLVAGIVDRRFRDVTPAATPSRSAAPLPPPPSSFFPAPAPGIVPPGLLPPPPGVLPQGPPPPVQPQRAQETNLLPRLPDEQQTSVFPTTPGPQDTSVLPSVPDRQDTTVFPQLPEDPDQPGRHSR